jgi:Transmembrane secretion effector
VPEATLVEPRPRRRDRVADAVRPFASRPYRLMWMGSTTSSLGDALVQIALVFAILHVGGTASDIGVVAAVKTVAQIAFLLAGGVWADRLRRQYVMLTADALRGVVQATLAALLLTGHAHVWELGVGAALYGSARSSRRPTRGSVRAHHLEHPVVHDHADAGARQGARPGGLLRLARLHGHHAGRLRGRRAACLLDRLHDDAGRCRADFRDPVLPGGAFAGHQGRAQKHGRSDRRTGRRSCRA